MKQTGKAQASPGRPPFGNGGNEERAAMSRTMTAGDQEQEADCAATASRRCSAAGVGPGLRDHVGRDLVARHAASTHRSAAVTPRSVPSSPAGAGRLFDRLEEPG